MKQEEIQLDAMLLMGLNDPINPDAKYIAGIKGDDKGTFFEYAFKTGTDLLAAIDIESELYSSKYHNIKREFLFRGHRDATWLLRPSVYRCPMDPIQQKRHVQYIAAHLQGTQISYEVAPFVRFLEEANNLGLLIEDESLALIKLYRARKKYSEGEWPPDLFNNSERHFPTPNQMRTLALAQHYGLPTRLLDWTTNPYNAAFFAVNSIDRKSIGENLVGIWVIPTLLLSAVQTMKFLEFVEVPKFQNANIIAQKGVFTSYIPSLAKQHSLDRPFPINDSKDSVKTFDAYLCEAGDNQKVKELITKVTGKPMLFTLPHDEVRSVQEKLDQLNISWTTMMPNLEGATKEATRQSRFDL